MFFFCCLFFVHNKDRVCSLTCTTPPRVLVISAVGLFGLLCLFWLGCCYSCLMCMKGGGGKGGREGVARGKRYGDICICVTDSLSYKAETNTPL